MRWCCRLYGGGGARNTPPYSTTILSETKRRQRRLVSRKFFGKMVNGLLIGNAIWTRFWPVWSSIYSVVIRPFSYAYRAWSQVWQSNWLHALYIRINSHKFNECKLIVTKVLFSFLLSSLLVILPLVEITTVETSNPDWRRGWMFPLQQISDS
jgi:hypothetical protein